MKTVGIGEIQKNTSIFNNLTDTIEIVDKRRKRTIAIVYPVKNSNRVASLAGKYKPLVSQTSDLQQAKQIAMQRAMEEKYDSID